MKNLTITIVLSCLIFLFGCSKQENKWEEAKKVNTISAYDKFIQQFPKSSYIKVAKTNISNLLIEKIKNMFFRESNEFITNDSLIVTKWNNELFDSHKWFLISYDMEMDITGLGKPIPGKTYVQIENNDSTFKMKCNFTTESKYKIAKIEVAENSVVEMKSGVKYTYRNGQFEK